MKNFNNRLALLLTKSVGSMWTAYVFALLSCVSLPQVLISHDVVLIIAWITQTFLQLVLLSVIMVGQNLQAEESNHKLEVILQTILENQEEEIESVEKIEEDIVVNEIT